MKVTIDKVQPGTGKVSSVVVLTPAREEGKPPVRKVLKHWTDIPFKDKLIVGAEVDIKTAERDNIEKTAKERWLTEVDGIGEKAAKTGGGGGFKSTPKTPQEIHSASICGIIKSGIEAAMDKKTLEPYFTAYWEQMERAK